KKYEAVINESPQDSEHWPLGLNQPLKNPNPQSNYRWKYFDEHFLYDYLYTNQTLDENFRENIKKIKQHIIDAINNKEIDKFNLKRMINGYILNDPWFGTYYVVDAAIENVKTKKHSIKRFHLMRPLTEISVELFENSGSKKINVLVP
ncbi:chondroitin sulfate synthase 2, partial [Brachionus plicatilis]